jgi:hypothetical protein
MLSPEIVRLLEKKQKGDAIGEKKVTVMVNRIIRVLEEEIFWREYYPPPHNYSFKRCLIFPIIGL